MHHVYLTSFFNARELPDHVVPYSAAVYQPKGFRFPKVDWTDIRGEDGNWIRPRLFVDYEFPALAYRDAMLEHYEKRRGQAEEWLNNLQHDAALCCWCPFDKAAQFQLKEFGSFICHTAVLGEFLRDRFDATVWEDADRRRMAVLTQIKI